MRNSLYTSFVIAPILIVFCFAQCKKEHPSSTITLYNKPLKTIQSYIQGNWRLEYEKGGFCASCVNYFNNVNYLWQFNLDDKIIQPYNDTLFTDTTITWIKDMGTFTNGDSSFTMNFYDKRGYPYNYIVDGIFNDTLILHDAYSSDAVFYHFSKL